jgi:WD40 repeat protein
MHNQLQTFRIQAMCSAIVMGIAALAGIPSLYGNEWAFTGIMPGGHRGPVNVLIYKGDFLLSVGDDGFLEIWNARDNVNLRTGGHALERFQISGHRITAMAARPEKDEVCLIENDGIGLWRVSAWNYKERRNIFSLQFRDPIGHISYSMGGSFIIAAGTGRTGLAFINADTGAMLPSPDSITGIVSLAVTGRSERSMLTYSPLGALSYWDLESGNETHHFNAPSNLFSPVLFSNNRYLAGVNAEGLAVIHAVTGELLARESSVPDASLLCAAGDDLFCLIQKEKTAAQLYRYTIDRSGRLITLGHVSLENDRFTSIAAGRADNTNVIVLGTSAGSLVLAGMNGQARALTVKTQTGIMEAAVSGSTIAFLAENGTMGFIPLDYNRFPAGNKIPIELNKEAYNRVTAFAAEGNDPVEQFVFWQDNNPRTQPLIRSSGPNSKKTMLSDITFRSPIRSAVSFGGKILFLDSTGNLSVVSPFDTGKNRRLFTFFSVGLMDAAFIDRNRLIIGRSAISGNTPFLMINVNTGETVPLPYPSKAGVIMHRGSSGSIYAVMVSPQSGDTNRENGSSNGETGVKTSILHIDPANITASISLVDFQGEDTQFSLVESPGGTAGSLAATIGGEGAVIYSGGGIQPLERTAGLPLKLFDGGQCLISLDGDGSICWHENYSGKLLAVFRLHPDGWTLQTEQRTMSGGL